MTSFPLIVITGASGFIGDHVVKYLNTEGYEIWQISYSANANPNCSKLIKWENLESISINNDRKVVVIHAGAISSYLNNNRKMMYESNVVKTELIGEWCQKNKFKLIHLSTIGIYDRPRFKKIESGLTIHSPKTPKSIYGSSKLEAERTLEKLTWLEYVVIRLPWVYGSDMRINSHLRVFAQWKKSKKIISRILWPGAVTVIHINDVCKIIHKLVKEEIPSTIKTVLPGEKSPFMLGEILSQDQAFKIDYNIVRKIARYLPFSLRVLLEEALVYENPLDLENHKLSDILKDLELEWQA